MDPLVEMPSTKRPGNKSITKPYTKVTRPISPGRLGEFPQKPWNIILWLVIPPGRSDCGTLHAELDRRSKIPRRFSSPPLHTTSNPPLQQTPRQHPCRDRLPAVQDVKRGAKNVMRSDLSAVAARQQACSASMRCSCSGVDGHSRDHVLAPASILGTCRGWVCRQKTPFLPSRMNALTKNLQSTRPENLSTPPSRRKPDSYSYNHNHSQISP